MREKLVKLADKFDAQGKHQLADAIDRLLVTASRPKTPLKSLKDDAKKDLLKFVYEVKSNSERSAKSLDELARRLRYFDADNFMKELGLDKASKDLHKVQTCADNAVKSMYAMSYGKSPSSSDMEQMADDFGVKDNDDHSPLDFFKSQSPYEEDFQEREQEINEEELSEGLDKELKQIYDRGGPNQYDLEMLKDPDEKLEDEDDDDDLDSLEDIDEEDIHKLWE